MPCSQFTVCIKVIGYKSFDFMQMIIKYCYCILKLLETKLRCAHFKRKMFVIQKHQNVSMQSEILTVLFVPELQNKQ